MMGTCCCFQQNSKVEDYDPNTGGESIDKQGDKIGPMHENEEAVKAMVDLNSDNEQSTMKEAIIAVKHDSKIRETGFGYFTERGRQLWIEKNSIEAEKNKEYIDTLQYNQDVSKPLYFWQLYSLLGTQRILNIVTLFYNSVFEDENAWFRDSFTQIAPVEHHIRTQTAFWLDSFGKGREYHGGEYRLTYHHKFNASQVMTEQGAHRWMFHMRKTLDSDQIDLTNDPRVRPAINQFLSIMMDKYGHEFDFDTDKVKYQ